MANIRSVQDYKDFLKDNRELLHKNAVRIEDLSPDDDWILDEEWDRIYEQEFLNYSPNTRSSPSISGSCLNPNEEYNA